MVGRDVVKAARTNAVNRLLRAQVQARFGARLAWARGDAVMADLHADRRHHTSVWARLKEERFTNVDLIVVLGALLITGFVGALSGAALFG